MMLLLVTNTLLELVIIIVTFNNFSAILRHSNFLREESPERY